MVKIQELNIMPITGMAVGIDQLCATICIDLGLKFIAALPCKDQEKLWPPKSQEKYRMIINHPLCTPILIYSGFYNNQCMQARNIWMVNKCDTLLAIFDGSDGGTANCVNYAKSIKKNIIEINPQHFK